MLSQRHWVEICLIFQSHIIDKVQLQGKMEILGLTRVKLMIGASNDVNADVENQKYVFTTLGEWYINMLYLWIMRKDICSMRKN